MRRNLQKAALQMDLNPLELMIIYAYSTQQASQSERRAGFAYLGA
jgi:hypothetical protein